MTSIEKRSKQFFAVQNRLFNLVRGIQPWKKRQSFKQRSDHGMELRMKVGCADVMTEVLKTAVFVTAGVEIQADAQEHMMGLALGYRLKENATCFFHVAVR